MKRTFKITRVEVGDWGTNFSIKDLDHENPKNSMSPEGLLHHIGRLAGLELEEIEGLEFTVELTPVSQTKELKRSDPLALCRKVIGTWIWPCDCTKKEGEEEG